MKCNIIGCEWRAVGIYGDSPRCLAHMPTTNFYVFDKYKASVERIEKMKDDWMKRGR